MNIQNAPSKNNPNTIEDARAAQARAKDRAQAQSISDVAIVAALQPIKIAANTSKAEDRFGAAIAALDALWPIKAAVVRLPSQRADDLQLVRNGYEPIVCQGKAAVSTGWQADEITVERIKEMREAFPLANNTGLRTGKLAAIDIDVIAPDHVERIAALAETMLGYTPLQRFGSKGLMLCYFNPTPIRKVTIFTDTEAKVEILGQGQQFIAFGIHPTTQKPFEWRGFDEGADDGIATPLNTPLAKLPQITPEQIAAFADQCATLMGQLGYSNPRARKANEHEKKLRVPGADEDAPHNVSRAKEHLVNCVATGHVATLGALGNDTIYELACLLMDRFYLSPEMADKLMLEIWYPYCIPNTLEDECRAIISHAAKYIQNEPGANAIGSSRETFKESLAGIKDEPKADGYTNSGGLSFRSMQDITPIEIDWLWPERIAAGKLTLLAGAPDGGKSQIAANIAATISNGGAWPFGEGTAEQGAVIWLSAEDDPADTTVPRLIAAGANRRLIFELKPVVRVEGGMRTLNVVEDLAEIAQVIEKIKADYGVQVRAIVIDPISAYMGGRAQGDSWKNSDVRHTMTPLLEFVARFGISTLGITHFKKGKDADVLNRVIDSIALPALSRATWLVAPEKDDEGNPTGRRLFLVGKKNIGRPVKNLAYNIREKLIDNGRDGTMPAPYVEWAGVVADTADDALAEQAGKAGKLEAAEDFLMRILGDGPISEKEIRKRAGEKHRWRTLQRAKEKLGIISERAGGLGGSGEWQWVLPRGASTEDNDTDAALFAKSTQ